jgi:MFS transporter, DHA2 family, multidrug resistance protein
VGRLASFEPAPLTGIKLVGGAFALALANFVVVLDSTIANVSVPHIAGGLAVSPTQGTWVITSYAVADAITVPLTGWLALRFGTVRWLLASLVGFGIFSMLCGLSTTLEGLVAFRILQGLSGGPLMPLTQTLLVRVFPPEKRAIGLALWAMTTTTAPIIGPILGGTISDNWSWHWIFFINVPIIIVCLFSVRALILPFDTVREKQRIDYVGLMLLVFSVGAFQIMLDTGRENDWFASGWIISLAVLAAIGFAAFVIWELTEQQPVVDLRIFKYRGFAASTFAVSFAYAAFFASLVLSPLWLQQYVGYTATVAGQTVAWVGVGAVLCAPIAARLTSRVDLRILVSAGVLWLAGASMLRTGWTVDADYWTLAFPQMIQGAGMPFFFIAVTALAMGSVPMKDQVNAAGLLSFVRTLSGAIGAAIATTAWDSSGRTARAEITAHMNGASDVMARLQGVGLSTEQARAMIERMVDVQAGTLGVIHIYAAASVAMALAAASVWLAPRIRPGGMLPTGH